MVYKTFTYVYLAYSVDFIDSEVYAASRVYTLCGKLKKAEVTFL